eukprot:gene39072-48261_t
MVDQLGTLSGLPAADAGGMVDQLGSRRWGHGGPARQPTLGAWWTSSAADAGGMVDQLGSRRWGH